MKFFLSNSDDLVDPNYDFLTDEHPPGRSRRRDDVYPYQMFNEPICDGVFLSDVPSRAISKQVEAVGSVQAFLKLPPSFPVMGDCGALKYTKKDVPSYKTDDVVRIYHRQGYTLGASVDHMIEQGAPLAEKHRRWEITLRNAQDFLSEYQAGEFNFIPIGVAQGWDPPSYRQAVEKLLEFGYKYIAIGGVTGLSPKALKLILEEIFIALPPDIDVHLLGVARLSDLSLFQRLGVTSLNGSTPIKRGPMGEYSALDGKKYEAIRVPFAIRDRRSYHLSGAGLKRLDHILDEGDVSEIDLVNLEQKCLSLLRAYDRDEVFVDEVLETVLRYNRLNGDKEDRRAKYEQTLRDHPWRSCPCEICRDIGIEVIIFRGNDRNRRRGFHNAWVFYRRFHAALAADS